MNSQSSLGRCALTRQQLTARGYLTKDGRVNFAGRQFIIFYVGDYDAASWLYQYTPVVWDEPAVCPRSCTPGSGGVMAERPRLLGAA